jgi:hypothetical protein
MGEGTAQTENGIKGVGDKAGKIPNISLNYLQQSPLYRDWLKLELLLGDGQNPAERSSKTTSYPARHSSSE